VRDRRRRPADDIRPHPHRTEGGWQGARRLQRTDPRYLHQVSHPMRPLFAVALLVGLAPAAPVPKDLKKKQDDKALLVGTWKPVGNRTEWFKFDEDGQMKVWNTGGSAQTGVPYTWGIDPDADPKQMTWGDTSPQRRPQWDCLYELDGDVLRIVY